MHGFELSKRLYRQVPLGPRTTEVRNDCIILKILDFIYLGINDLRVPLLSNLAITNTHIIGIILKNTIFAFVMAKLFLNDWHFTT